MLGEYVANAVLSNFSRCLSKSGRTSLLCSHALVAPLVFFLVSFAYHVSYGETDGTATIRHLICSSCSSCYLVGLPVSLSLSALPVIGDIFSDSGSHWILISLTTFLSLYLSLWKHHTLDYLDLHDSTKNYYLISTVATCSKMFIGGLNWDTTDGILSPCYNAYHIHTANQCLVIFSSIPT